MESKMKNPKHADRREFIKGAAVAGTGLSLAGGESLLGEDLKKHPVQLGVLGLGMMGARHITRLLRLQQEGIVKITAVSLASDWTQNKIAPELMLTKIIEKCWRPKMSKRYWSQPPIIGTPSSAWRLWTPAKMSIAKSQ